LFVCFFFCIVCVFAFVFCSKSQGEIQLSGEERKKTLDGMFKDIAQIVVEKVRGHVAQDAMESFRVLSD
jgi:hypothetical protein